MQRCAFLSMDSLKDFESYDHLLIKPFKEHGWQAEHVSWRDERVNWDDFESVIIRSPWDYQQDHQKFLDVLKDIDESAARLDNSLDLVRWNINKNYLRELEEQGIEIVPTLWRNDFDAAEFSSFYEKLDTSEIIIKPTVSAGADDTFRIPKKRSEDYTPQLQSLFSSRSFMVQPFMDLIIEEGEFSVFFFGDTYSHTILKTPKKEDFRVQEEHGGRLQLVEPEDELIQLTKQVLALLEELPLYSRVDFVRTSENSFALMELELIEPSLYFNMDEESPHRFARVFARWMQEC